MFRTRRNFLIAISAARAAMPRGAFASERWTDKKPAEWNSEDIQIVLYRSAWVREAPLFMSTPPPTAAPGQSAITKPTEYRVLVRWESALPIRLALRTRQAPDPGHYVLSISRLPLPFLAALSGDRSGRSMPGPELANQVVQATSLGREGKDRIPAAGAEWAEPGASPKLLISFLHGQQPIKLEDREVNLVSRVGPLSFTARFTLKQMIYHGNLEL